MKTKNTVTSIKFEVEDNVLKTVMKSIKRIDSRIKNVLGVRRLKETIGCNISLIGNLRIKDIDAFINIVDKRYYVNINKQIALKLKDYKKKRIAGAEYEIIPDYIILTSSGIFVFSHGQAYKLNDDYTVSETVYHQDPLKDLGDILSSVVIYWTK